MGDRSSRAWQPMTHLGNMPIEQFLAEYWQKKPLHIPNAFPDFEAILAADEIAGLSLENEVDSRLVIQTKNSWQVEHGPLEETRFANLPEKQWTLLVQHMDSLDPGFNALLDAFRFIPNWRLDDIMVSYAADQGGVGPHFDYYDVFLLQAEGCRQWHLGQNCNADSPLVPDQPMKILKNFQTEHTIVAQPGDLLYVPARIAHWGIAQEECQTYSIGFRAPSHSDFLLDFSQEMASRMTEDERYQDTALHPQRPAAISQEAVAQFKNIIHKLDNDTDIARWLGEYSTQLKAPIEEMYTSLAAQDLASDTHFTVNTYSRLSYYPAPEFCWLFVNGSSWRCSSALAMTLCERTPACLDDFSPKDQQVIYDILEKGLLVGADREAT